MVNINDQKQDGNLPGDNFLSQFTTPKIPEQIDLKGPFLSECSRLAGGIIEASRIIPLSPEKVGTINCELTLESGQLICLIAVEDEIDPEILDKDIKSGLVFTSASQMEDSIEISLSDSKMEGPGYQIICKAGYVMSVQNTKK